MEKILIVKTSSLGDIIQTYPVLDYLRTTFPSAQIDWVVEDPYLELVKAHPGINKTIPIATKQWRSSPFSLTTLKDVWRVRRLLREERYDVVFDLQGNLKSGFVLSQVKSCQKIGFDRKSVPEWPNTFFTNRRYLPPAGENIRDDYLFLVKAFFNDSSPYAQLGQVLNLSDIQRATVQSILQNPMLEKMPKVVVCPGSAWKNKQLTTETLIAFLQELQKYLNCNFLFIFGSDEEREAVIYLHQLFVQHSVVVDRMSLPAVQNLMAASDLVIAMDSSPLHLAGTTQTPSFSVFGPSSAAKYKPAGESHFAFQGSCPYGEVFEKRCPTLRSCPTGACIRELSSTPLFTEFQRWWKKLQHPSSGK